MCDVFVAWLDIEMSLIEPSHLSVSVDDVLSELWLLVSAIFVVEADVCKSDVDQCCDDDLDNNSLSCRSLCGACMRTANAKLTMPSIGCVCVFVHTPSSASRRSRIPNVVRGGDGGEEKENKNQKWIHENEEQHKIHKNKFKIKCLNERSWGNGVNRVDVRSSQMRANHKFNWKGIFEHSPCRWTLSLDMNKLGKKMEDVEVRSPHTFKWEKKRKKYWNLTTAACVRLRILCFWLHFYCSQSLAFSLFRAEWRTSDGCRVVCNTLTPNMNCEQRVHDNCELRMEMRTRCSHFHRFCFLFFFSFLIVCIHSDRSSR